MLTHQTRLDELKATGKLPSPTGAAIRILELTQQDDVGIADIARILKSDPSLAGKVLRVTNSSRSGLAQPIANLPYAVSFLGLKTVRRLVLGFSVLANCSRGLCQGFDYDEFWRHSLATAMFGQTFGTLTESIEPEEAYCCGLLGQIGRLALATVHPQRYSCVLQATTDPADLCARELAEFGIDHNQLTSAMLADWRLPDFFVEATLNQQESCSESAIETPAYQLTQLLKFSSRLADTWLASPQGREDLIPELLETANQYHLTSAAVAQLSEEAMADWSEWCSLLELPNIETIPLATTIENLENPSDRSRSRANCQQDRVLRILVVDDELLSRRYMERHLVEAGHEVMTAASGHDALRVMLEFNPQVIFTDWEMPEMDGLQLCRTIRESRIGRQVYVILVTSHEDKRRQKEAFAAGCDDFLTKPVYHQELKARARAISRILGLQAELAREKNEVQQYAAELSIGNRELQREALTDALTGLPNRRFAFERLRDLWSSSGQLGCMMIDVDNFKSINDTYGHPAGDLVLCETASALAASIRKTDFLCRFGGEEFLVIYDGNDLSETRSAAERLRENIEKNFIESELYSGNVTVSIGVAVRNEKLTSIESLLKSADDALYAAKQADKNCVQVMACT